MAEELDKTKAQFRAEMKTRLAEMGDASRRVASLSACDRLVSLEAFAHASVLMLYMPLATEVDVTPVALRCFQSNKTVCVPKVDWHRREITPVEVTSFDDRVMDIDEHGVRTPRSGRAVSPSLLDLVVVPGLAFDADGHRLGRGGGYYDRFLARLRPSATKVALIFDCQMIDAVPSIEHDVPVDIVVSDRRVTHVGGSRSRR